MEKVQSPVVEIDFLIDGREPPVHPLDPSAMLPKTKKKKKKTKKKKLTRT